MSNLAKDFVTHEGNRFFVSTIDRPCSAVGCSDMIYAETIVWEWPEGQEKRGPMVAMGEAAQGSVNTHIRFVKNLKATGDAEADGKAATPYTGYDAEMVHKMWTIGSGKGNES